MLGHLKINRAIATRYDQLADSFLGMLFIASTRYWIKFVHATYGVGNFPEKSPIYSPRLIIKTGR